MHAIILPPSGEINRSYHLDATVVLRNQKTDSTVRDKFFLNPLFMCDA
ncbi:MAG: hypothetical protein ISR62_04725 [Desulfobacteraceae bacterium]|nr:hypothetical protein [Desulfobacterales bacterium]MBL6967707.1 hypothetical protein [Desulfobacteraceae bacterium]MBL7102388.1 hypothetical protein [Desulfobacteraceae bacterium]MBL7173605.1 hypothetical protein [Desulfobacteraceae bacterium]